MDILTFLYLATGVIFGLAFIPQIRTLWNDTSGAAAISISSWSMLTTCSIVAFLYALVNVGDIYYTISCGVAVLGNVSVLSLALTRRFQACRETNLTPVTQS